MNKNDLADNCCINSFDGDPKSYWDNVFRDKDQQNWHQDSPKEINSLINEIGHNSDDLILCAGVGDSTLIDELLAQGFKNIVANDISEVALDKIKSRVGKSGSVSYVVEDLMNSKALSNYDNQLDLWIDRATLHFFTTCKEKDHYFKLVDSSVKAGGHAILGVFSKNNKAKCCGLDLQLWSVQSLINRMQGFELVNSITTLFTEKNGNQREYIYTLFRKN